MIEGTTLTPEHRQYLESLAIDPDEVSMWGVRSVSDPQDLPADLSNFEFALPGIVYPLRHLDGSITHQIRLDNPELDEEGKPKNKYLQPSGSGTIITVPQNQAEKVGKAKTLVIVEGTKQTLAAALATAEMDDVLVVGIQGASGWRQQGGMHDDLIEIAAADSVENVRILFDADVQTNPAVFDAAKDLRRFLSTVASVDEKKIRYVPLEGLSGDKEGLDDYLATVGDRSKIPSVFTNLLAGSKPLPRAVKKQKADPKKSTDERIEVRMSVAQIVKVKSYFDSDLGEEVDHEEVLLHAAAEISKVEYHLDEEKAFVTGTTLFLTVAVPGPLGQVLYFHDIEIASSDLPKIGDWLDRLPDGAGIGIERPTLPQDEIANAIRDFGNPSRVLRTGIIERFGWYLPTGASQYLYALPQASTGPDALHLEVVGRPPKNSSTSLKPKTPSTWTKSASRTR